MLIDVRVKPNSKMEKIMIFQSELVVYLTSPATKGKANAELLKILKKIFGKARLVSGARSRTKVMEVPQETFTGVRAAVEAATKDSRGHVGEHMKPRLLRRGAPRTS